MRHIFATIAAGVLGACTLQSTLPAVNFNAPTLVVFGDTGGNPYEYARFWDVLNRTGKTVQLGECNSACTMFLSLPRACMISGTRFGFHSATGPVLENYIARYLPVGIRERYLNEWSRSSSFTKLTAEELQAINPSLKLCATPPLSAR